MPSIPDRIGGQGVIKVLSNISGSPILRILDLSDVDSSSLSDGYFLEYNASTSNFITTDTFRFIKNINVTDTLNTQNLNVTGIITIGSELSIGNDLSVDGNLTVNGIQAKTGNFSVYLETVDLKVTGISTLGSVKIDENIIDTVSGNLILQADDENSIDVRNKIVLNNDTQSTAVDNGSFETVGGVGIAKNLNVGGSASFTGDGTGIDVTLASAGGITTTGGDLYVGNNLYIQEYLSYQKNFNEPNGIAYFDNTGKLVSSGNTSTAINSSNFILTTDESSGIVTWSSLIDGGFY